MIRAVYRWHVSQERHADFVTWWHEGTIRIRSSHRGALGSTLLRPTGDDEHLLAIARWASKEDLERFWAEPGGGTPFGGAELVSAEIFEELDDLTLGEGTADGLG